jgi:Tol biopolymer transport system component/DNA-binding winged helix-turn-helix (wHTH) protein
MVSPAQQRFFAFGVFQVDVGRRLLLRRGDPVPLTPKAFEILLVLIQDRERVVGKDELMKLVWPDAVVEENNLTRNISSLRKALGEGPGENRFIVTVPGRGYQFAGDIPAATPDADVFYERHSRSRMLIDEQFETDTAIQPNETRTVGRSGRPVALWLTVATGACVLLIIVAVWLYVSRQREASLPPLRLVQVTSLADVLSGSSISPDGNYVAFERQSDSPQVSGIYIKQIGADSYLQLTRGASDYSPAWSPDGMSVAFSRYEEQKHSIYSISSLGGVERKLYAAAPAFGDLAWSPDGRFIAFSAANPDPDSYSIFSLAVDTLETHKISQPGPGYQDAGAAYSPDGTQIAFIRVSGNLTAAEIFVMSAQGGTARRLTFDDGAIIGPPVWARDGKSIVFSSTRSGLPTIWRISASGGSAVQVTETGGRAIHPSLAATRHRLAFEQEMENSSLWSLNLADRSKKDFSRQITASKGFNGPAELSADGKKIVFVSDRSGTGEIYTCRADGSNLLRLTKLQNGGAPVNPRWSPDGQKIAFDSILNERTAIFVIGADGGPPHRLTHEAFDNINPSWSHDGRWIYFASNRTGQWQIWKIPGEGGDALQLTRQGGFGGFESADGKFFYYAQTAAHPDIWKLRLDDREEAALSPRLHLEDWSNWALVDKGILFLHDTPKAHPMMSFLDLATARIRDVTPLQKQPWHPRLSASADGQFVLYQQIDMRVSNVMLLENFR